MLLAPIKALVRLVALLPVILRPGIFLAVAFMLLWAVFVRPRAPALYHAAWRVAARGVDVVVGLVLLPEYAVTATRRKRGLEPGSATVLVNHIADPILSGTQGAFERHDRDRVTGSLMPWRFIGLIVAVCAGAWLVMDKVTPTSPTRHALTVAFQYWRDVEAWANVSSDRRAAAGGWYPPLPVVQATRQRRDGMHVSLTCSGSQTCSGTVTLTARGRSLESRMVTLKPDTQAVVSLRPSKRGAHFPSRVSVAVNHL